MRITDAVRNELNQLQQARGGLLTAEAVLQRARNKKSALHEQFDWNTARNAERGLLDQAQELIVRVKVSIQTSEESTVRVRAYWSLATDRISGGGFRSIQAIMDSKELRDELLKTALSELEALRARYERLTELTAVFGALAQVQRRHGSPKRVVKRKGRK